MSNIGVWGVKWEMVVCAILLQSGRDDVRCVSSRFTVLFAGCGSRCGDLQRKRSTNWWGVHGGGEMDGRCGCIK